MAAYGAAISLRNTIKHILTSSRISLAPPSSQILLHAYEAMARLKIVLLKLDDTGYSKIRMKVNALDERIKEVIWDFEDSLESRLVDQIRPQLERGERNHLSFSVDLRSLRQIADCFVERVTVMEAEYDIELLNMPEEEGQPLSSRIDFGGINSNMVGFSDDFEQVTNYLLREGEGEGEGEGEDDESGGDAHEENYIIVTGMAGVGKTTLAKKVFDDPSIRSHFEHRAWVNVGRKCETNETLRCILAQLDPNTHHQMLTQADDDDYDKLVRILEDKLDNKKCLVVLDDVWEWDTRLMDHLSRRRINVRILLTSRFRSDEYPSHVLSLLDEEESKKLLGERLFGEEGFPPHLVELGEIVAEKCEGLPLMIITIAELLSKANKSIAEKLVSNANKSTREELNKSIQEYWTEVAEKQHNSIFVDTYNQISEVLFPSYDYLPQYFKMFFLYLGSFIPYKDIIVHYHFHRLTAEGFLEPIGKQTSEDFMMSCTTLLSQWYHLVLYNSNESIFSRQEFRVHSCWQHVCKKEASRIKFLHVLQSCDDVMKDQRRLCAHCNTLFAFKQVHDSIKSDCASTARSLICIAPDHKYPVSIHAMKFNLLRVLDASTVRLYHIPLEFQKLVCLKYLSLTCNTELPIFISNFFNLQTLMIFPYLNIKKCGAVSYMPVEIWDMPELQHIEIYGRDLPIPNSDATLDKLTCLFGVSAKSCTREILKRIRNLEELMIQMELKPYDDDDDNNSLSGLVYISVELQNLDVLKYYIVNPEMKYESMVPLSMFSSSLTKLYLSGLGCPWKHMNEIGLLLPNLKVLKLEHYAFQGPDWDIKLDCFYKLETLVIEDADLVCWRCQHGSLPRLELLSIRHCYKLQQLAWTCDPSRVETTIELVDCNPLAATSAKQLRPESLFTILCYSSF